MVSFSCCACQDTLKKPKLQSHYDNRCGAPFTCLDCNKDMGDGEFQKHTSCISEAQKYEKSVWKGDKVKGKGKNQQNQQKQAANGVQANGKPAPAAQAEAPVASTSAFVNQPSAEATPAPEVDKSTSKKEKKDKKRKRTDAAAGESVEAVVPVADAAKAAEPAVEAEAAKKKSKKAKKGEEKPEQNGQQDPKEALQAALSAALSGDNASVALKDVLSQAGASTDDLLASIKVEKGKKGKFVLTF